ncbi:MAG TPA: LLM class flavin-dependent oxidoreductase [Thermoanaerobaculia bacterium]|nr:LLM class flavin-dependent oxidoreductase [Thermoanaerobaculia bacterium]
MTTESTTPYPPQATAPRRLHIGVTPWGHGGSDDLRDLIRQARLAESLGFDSFFIPESHLHAQARPAPLIVLAALAGATERIQLGTTSLLLPLRDPLLLAEEIATLDHLSNGRLILGLGRGFRPGTFDAFGVDPRCKRERFEQVLATMLRAWGLEPAWAGAPGATEQGVARVEPSPLQRPHPPLWLAAFGPKAIAQAARLGLPYFASPMESLAAIDENYRAYRELSQQVGAVPVMRTLFVSDDSTERHAVAHALRLEREALARSRARVGSRSVEADEAVEGSAVVGDRESAITGIREILRRLGPTHLIARTPGGVDQRAAERSLRALASIRSGLDVGTMT